MEINCEIEIEGHWWYFKREHSWQTTSGGWLSADSRLFVCPRCARTWGSARLPSASLHWPCAQVCFTCPPAGDHTPPGSILYALGSQTLDFDIGLLQALPPDLLKREAWLHLGLGLPI
jgi:hypothetical protein